mmetsp:Transcript_77521/g.137208  ORF Transcript_77521/g.137208 Transcript_77521/m.137208 type:complete len:265 (+) Transcript_77521:65-859(+)
MQRIEPLVHLPQEADRRQALRSKDSASPDLVAAGRAVIASRCAQSDLPPNEDRQSDGEGPCSIRDAFQKLDVNGDSADFAQNRTAAVEPIRPSAVSRRAGMRDRQTEPAGVANKGPSGPLLQAVDKFGTPIRSSVAMKMKYATADALAHALRSKRAIVMDVRQKYEFDGGHIDGALHCDWRAGGGAAVARLFSTISRKAAALNMAVVVYCEFGGKRSPEAYKAIFKADHERSLNGELYVLHGGYSRFCQKHGELCCPHGGYVPE